MDKKNINIELILTKSCNFRCTYCYEKKSRSDEDIQSDVIAEFPNFVRRIQDTFNSNQIIITWFGGEPTLQSNVVDYLTRELAPLEYTKFLIITNGYNIESIKQLLLDTKSSYDKHKFHVQISYDCSPVQELHRLEANSLDGYMAKELVLKSIYWLAENGIQFSTKNTIRLDTIKYLDLVYFDFIKLSDFIKDRYNVVLPNMRMTLDTCCNELNEQDLQITLNTLREKLSAILLHQIKSGVNNFNWLSQEKSLCTLQSNIITVDTDGCLYPCHSAVFSSCKSELSYNKTLHEKDIKNLFREKPFGAQLPENHPCSLCTACYCARCNIHKFQKSVLSSYNDKMIDFANNKTYCSIMKEISKYVYAKQQLLSSLG